ncbi:MAG: ABC transporter ATP-binding protein [Firmicutes bacterium]|nr:ABC transporter ATP-binding protein [Bacillota bacterium]
MLNTSNQQNCIVVSGLQKSYGSLKAVNGIDFTVKKGEIFGLLGPNGAGKSTTVEILAGLRQRDAGQVTVLGMDPATDSSKLKSRIGMQLQSASLYPRLKVAEILRLFASFYRRPLPPTEVLKRVNLEDKAGSLTSTLSGGQSQRLSVAIAMIGDGELLFLDEPTTGLDPQARRLLWEVIATLKQKGKTVVLTTHYMEEAEYLCDRVAVIDYGRIIALGSPPELIASHFQEQAIEFDAPGLSGGDELHLLDAVKRVESNGDTVTLYTTDAIRTMEAVLAVAATRGMEVQNFTVRRATLEDLFLKLTGRRIRE